MPTPSCLIVGGGIAGPVTAMALQRAGIHSEITEARATPADTEGSFLTVASNGMAGLDTLGLADAVTTSGIASPRMVMRSGTGRRLGSVLNASTRPGMPPSTTLRRGDLHRILRDAATARGIPFHPGRHLIDVEHDDDATVARFDDGTQHRADVLIGADGIHSTVRHLIDPHAPTARYSGLVSIGGQAHGVRLDAEPNTFHMVFGRRTFFSYLLRGTDEVWWFANVARAEPPTRDELGPGAHSRWRDELRELLRDDRSPALDLLDRTTGPLGTYAISDLPPVPRWHTDRMAVLGDAAHATSPNAGQGASLAIESALVLAAHLASNDHPERALTAYSAERRDRVERIVRYSARLGGTKTAGPVARRIRDAVMPLVLPIVASPRRHAWMYDYTAPDPARTATC